MLPISNEVDSFQEKNEITSNMNETNEMKREDEHEEWHDESELHHEECDLHDDLDANSRDFSQNQVALTFSWSLMNQIRYLARSEGIDVEDLLIELVAESVTKRAFEDQNKTLPSHLMTRNGYVHNNQDGNAGFTQPQMSHHALNNNRNPNAQQNRNKPNLQSRNNQYNNNNARYQNSQGRNYQNNNRNNFGQNSGAPFRQNNSPYNTQPRHNARPNTTQNQSQNTRFNSENYNPNPLENKNKKY